MDYSIKLTQEISDIKAPNISLVTYVGVGSCSGVSQYIEHGKHCHICHYNQTVHLREM